MRSLLLVLVLVVIAGGLFGLWRVLSSTGVELAGAEGAEVFAHERDAVALEAGELDDRGRADARAEDSGAELLALEGLAASDANGLGEQGELPPILTGRVMGADGAPLEGARVFAATGFSWFAVPLDIEPDAAARRHGAAVEVSTGADGRFVFREGLAPGPLRLAVRAAGHEPLHEERGRLPVDLPHDLGDLALRPGVVLAGRVVDLMGEPVAGARLLQVVERGLGGMTVTLPGRGIPLGATDAEGRFLVDELPAGPWRILIDATGYRVREESGRAEVAGERQAGLVFVVEPGAVIGGTLRGAPAEMLARLRVEARMKAAESERQTGILDAAPEHVEPSEDVHPRVRIASFDASGAFALGGLAARTAYKLTVWERDAVRERWKRSSGVEAAVAWPGTGGVELVYAPQAALVFQVVDASTRAPLEDFEVWAGAGSRPGALRDDDGEALREHPDGRVRFADLRPGAPGSTVTLRIRAAGHGQYERKDIALANGEELDLGTLALEPAPRVLVHVVDAATEAPVADARVFMAKVGESGSYAWYLRAADAQPTGNTRVVFGRTDETGTAVLAALPGEECSLVVSAAGFVASEPGTVLVTGADDHEQTVRLARGGTAVVTVVDTDGRPVSGVSVEHREMQRRPGDQRDTILMAGEGESMTDEDGIVRIATLVPGDHEFRIRDEIQGMIFFGGKAEDAESWARASLVEGATVHVTLTTEPRGRLTGVVTEGGTPLAGASLRLRAKAAAQRRQYLVMGGAAGSRYSALTGYGGRFEFRDVKSGEYTIVLDHPEREMPHSLEVTIRPNGTELVIALPVALIEGRVRDSDGRPLRGVEVRVRGAERGLVNIIMPDGATMYESDTGEMRTDFQSQRRRRKRTDATGRYSLRGVTTGVPLNVSVSSAFHVGDRRRGLVLEPDEILRGVDFELDPAGRIEVVLSRGPGGAQGYVHIQAVQVVSAGESSTSHSTGIPSGTRRTLSAILPGRWLVSAFRKNGGVRIDLGTQAVEVAALETAQVTFIVP